MLTRMCYVVRSYESSAPAMASFPVFKPDLVLLDLIMPGMNGVETLPMILSKYPDQRVVVITGGGDMDMTRKTMEMGACEYVMKPFSSDVLGRVVSRWCD